jgi:hypothetical protein
MLRCYFRLATILVLVLCLWSQGTRAQRSTGGGGRTISSESRATTSNSNPHIGTEPTFSPPCPLFTQKMNRKLSSNLRLCWFKCPLW